MDVQDHTTHSGHESHGVHLCHRCGWPFPNLHPSAKHRRAHKKICGTIEGYTILNSSEVVSDDEHHSDDDKDRTPSSKIEMKGSLSRSEDEFADAVTEFVDTGSAKKALDRDMFFSFKDAENDGTNEELSAAPIEISKVDTTVEVSEKTDSLVEKTEQTEIKTLCDSSESNLEVTRTGDPVKDGVVGLATEPSHVSQSQEAKSIDVMAAREEKGQGEENGQESQTNETSETVTEEAKDSEITETTPEVSANVGGYHDNVKQENCEKLESVTTDGVSEEIKQEIKPDCKHVLSVVKESETVEEIKIETVELDGKVAPEVVKGTETGDSGRVGEEIEHEKLESDHKHVSEVAKEAEVDQTVPVLDEKVEADGKVAPEVVKGTETDDSGRVGEEIEHEKLESDHKHVSEVAKEAEVDQTVPVLDEKVEADGKVAPEVVKGPETDDSGCVGEEIKHENFESDHIHVIEVAKEAEVDQTVTVPNEKVDLGAPNEQIQEVVKEPIAVLTKKVDLDAPELEKSSSEQIQEAVKEPDTVLTEKEALGGPHLEKQSFEPVALLTEKDLCTPESEGSSKEQIQEAVKEPDTVLTEKQSNEHTHEVVEKPDSVLTEREDLSAPEMKKNTQENIVEEAHSVVTEKVDLGAHKSETCSNGEVIEQKVINDRNLVADISTETVTLKDSSDTSVTNNKDASDVVPEPIAEEGNDKLMNNQDSGADLTVDSSSHNSLEGTLGSNSVLSTTSIDAETLQSAEKSKVNSGKSNAATSDVYEPPSFMTLVEPESKDNKCASSEAQDSHQKPNSEASQAGWFPTLTDVNTESEGRKKNEEAMEKVTNVSAGKQSKPLKNLLGEARSPSGKQPEPVVQKDEAAVNSSVNDDVLSPPKLIDDGKKGRKKVKGISSWVPFACCSSVNAVK